MNVHGNTVHNSQEVETTQMSIIRGMDKQNVVCVCVCVCVCVHAHTYSYDGILFSHKKERSTDTCYNTDRP